MSASHSSDTLVIQSHRDPLPYDWLSDCIDSVQAWARDRGFDYRWLGDDCFSALPADLWQKTRNQLVIASDLARLYAMRQALQEGYHCVVWCDADFLVVDAAALQLPASDFAFGREVWIERAGSQKPRARVKIHNAFMLFRQGNPFLPFYIHSAERLLRLNDGGMSPQFIGPKLLTALHNMLHFTVVENAGMLSPPVAVDILRGGGEALELFLKHHASLPAGINLSTSLADQRPLQEIDMLQVIRLLAGGFAGGKTWKPYSAERSY